MKKLILLFCFPLGLPASGSKEESEAICNIKLREKNAEKTVNLRLFNKEDFSVTYQEVIRSESPITSQEKTKKGRQPLLKYQWEEMGNKNILWLNGIKDWYLIMGMKNKDYFNKIYFERFKKKEGELYEKKEDKEEANIEKRINITFKAPSKNNESPEFYELGLTVNDNIITGVESFDSGLSAPNHLEFERLLINQEYDKLIKPDNLPSDENLALPLPVKQEKIDEGLQNNSFSSFTIGATILVIGTNTCYFINRGLSRTSESKKEVDQNNKQS